MFCPFFRLCCLFKSSTSIDIPTLNNNNNISLQQFQPSHNSSHSRSHNTICIRRRYLRQPQSVSKNIEKDHNIVLFIFQIHQSQVTSRPLNSSSSSNETKISISFQTFNWCFSQYYYISSVDEQPGFISLLV